MTTGPDRDAMDQAVSRGSDLLKHGKYEDALGAFKTALLIDGENAKVLALLGLTYFRASDFDKARPIYEDLVERAPTDASHRLNLGLVYLKLGEASRAITALEASRSLDPSAGRAVSYLGLAYARAGRYTEAYRAFLIAGQNDFATEIEQNLTPSERDGIHAQLGRTPAGVYDAPARPARTPSQQDLAAKAAVAATPQGLSSPEITITPAKEDSGPIPTLPSPFGRSSESMQFVLPPAEQKPAADISKAVKVAAPVNDLFTRTKSGGTAPRPLSELATDGLVRPIDDDEPFEIAPNGALVIRIEERAMTRLDGIHVSGGELSYELAMRRSRGHLTNERFDFGGSPMHLVTGKGYLIAIPDAGGKRSFTAVGLDDDIFYLREDLVFAFESTLRWENGNVPGLRGKLPVVQFRGDGAVVMSTAKPLVRIKLPANGVVFVDAARLAGWIGRVIPRAVVPPVGGPMGELCVECTGEGVVLVEPAPEGTATFVARPPEPPPVAVEEPPQVDPEVADFASSLAEPDNDTI